MSSSDKKFIAFATDPVRVVCSVDNYSFADPAKGPKQVQQATITVCLMDSGIAGHVYFEQNPSRGDVERDLAAVRSILSQIAVERYVARQEVITRVESACKGSYAEPLHSFVQEVRAALARGSSDR